MNVAKTSYDQEATAEVKDYFQHGSTFEDVLHRDLLLVARSLNRRTEVEPGLRKQIINELVDLYLDYRIVPGSYSEGPDGTPTFHCVGPGGYQGLRSEIEEAFKRNLSPEWRKDVLARLYYHIAKGFPTKPLKPRSGLVGWLADLQFSYQFSSRERRRSSDNAIRALMHFDNLGSEFDYPLSFAIQGLGPSQFAVKAVENMSEAPSWSPGFLESCRPAIEAFGKLAQRDSKALAVLEKLLLGNRYNEGVAIDTIHALGNAATENPKAVRVLLDLLPTLQMGEVKAELLEVVNSIVPGNKDVLAAFRDYRASEDTYAKRAAVQAVARREQDEPYEVKSTVDELLDGLKIGQDILVLDRIIRGIVEIGRRDPLALQKLFERIQQNVYEHWRSNLNALEYPLAVIDQVTEELLDETGDIPDTTVTNLEGSEDEHLQRLAWDLRFIAGEVTSHRRDNLTSVFQAAVNLLKAPADLEEIDQPFLALLYFWQIYKPQDHSRYFTDATSTERKADYWLVEKVLVSLDDENIALAVLDNLLA